ncbi:MAG: hypothetical protein ACO1QB_16015 [Verrucomicrobiales bacterium]
MTKFGRKFKSHWKLACLLAAGMAVQKASAQYDPSYIMRTSPYPAFNNPEPGPYNLKWGKLSGRFRGSIQTEFNDNINLSSRNAQSDVIIAPQFGIGFMWPISERNVLNFDIGAGYRFYLDHSELNQDSWLVSPDTRFNYQMRIFKAQVSIHDNFHIQVDPLSNPSISGDGRSLANFRRLNNTAGIQFAWQAMKDVTLLGGYDYVIDRTLSSSFSELDRDDHVFSLAAYRPITPRITGGFTTTYVMSEYMERVQNNGDMLTFGPVLLVKVSDFVSLDSSVGWTIADYEQTGTIGDRSDFEGLTWSGGIRHTINSKMNHSARVVKNLAPGFGSNYSEVMAFQYGLSVKVAPAMSLNTTFSYEDITASGAVQEHANRYLIYAGTGFRVSKNWRFNLGYSFSWKDSDVALRDYTQNRFTLDMTRQF